MDHAESGWNRSLGWLVVVASGLSAAAIALLHLLQPGLRPSEAAISEYVHGQYGFLMTSTFFAQSLASLALATSVMREGLEQRRVYVGGALFILAAVGAAVAGGFPADPASPFPQTRTGAIHTAAGLVRFVSLAIALPLLSSAFRTHPRFRKIGKALVPLAILFVITFLASIILLANIGLFGLGQRSFIAILLAWMCLAIYPIIRRRGVTSQEGVDSPLYGPR